MLIIKKLLNNKIIQNFLYLLSSMIIGTLGSFLSFTFLGRKMSVDGYGMFTSLIAISTVVAIFTNNTLAGIVANREIALEKKYTKTILRKFFKGRVFLYLISCLILFFYLILDRNINFILYFSLLLIMIFNVFWELFEQVCFGLAITKYSANINIVNSFIWLIVVIIIPSKFAIVEVIFFLFSILQFLKTIIYGIIIKNRIKNLEEETYKESLSYKKFFLSSLPYLYNRIIGIVSTQLPILLLNGYANLTQTAYYSVGEKFTTPIIYMVTAAISSVFPFITKILKTNRESASLLIVHTITIVLCFGVSISTLLSSTSNIWLVAIVGNKYINAVESFNYQIWFTFILAVDCIFSMLLSSDFKQKILSVVTTIDVLIMLPGLYLGMRGGEAKILALSKLIVASICLIYHIFLITYLYAKKGKEKTKLIGVIFYFIFYMSLNIFFNFTINIKLLFIIISFILSGILIKDPIIKFINLIRTQKIKDF